MLLSNPFKIIFEREAGTIRASVEQKKKRALKSTEKKVSKKGDSCNGYFRASVEEAIKWFNVGYSTYERISLLPREKKAFRLVWQKPAQVSSRC